MHHLLLLLPLLGLGLFIFLPWQVALPLYVIILVGSLAIYWKILKAQRKRPVMGQRAMIGDRARVINVQGSEIEVDYEGEIWRAASLLPVQPGQQVIIEAVDGLTLRVAPVAPES
jgi:membrane protein implicated in regulation of membrane protease activity